MKNSQDHSQEKISQFDSIVYWCLTIPIMGLAAVSIPFLNLNVTNERVKLQETYRSLTEDIKIKEQEHENLLTTLEKLKGEKLKQYAENLGLHKPARDQVVIIDVPREAFQYRYTAQKTSVHRDATAAFTQNMPAADTVGTPR